MRFGVGEDEQLPPLIRHPRESGGPAPADEIYSVGDGLGEEVARPHPLRNALVIG